MITNRHRFTPVDPRLNRHVRHDDRSYAYAVGVLPKSAIKAVSWERRTPILDQGNLGKCTAESFTGAAGTDSASGQGWTSVTLPGSADTGISGLRAGTSYALDDTFSTMFYALETDSDAYPGTYPPDDCGSDGLGAMAAAKRLGMVKEYRHAMSYAAAVSAVQAGPLLWGTTFFASMEATTADGYFDVDVDSEILGGHEMLLRSYDPETDEWGGDNSWGESWGRDGSFKITGSRLSFLLSQHGDATLPVWTYR